jgi:hypothetical protein
MGRRSREVQVKRIEEEPTDSAEAGKTSWATGPTREATAHHHPKALSFPG